MRLCEAKGKSQVFFKGSQEMVRRGKRVFIGCRTEIRKKTFLRQPGQSIRNVKRGMLHKAGTQ